MCKKLIVFCLIAATATIASAEKITYVDATHGAIGNTTLANGQIFDYNHADPNLGWHGLSLSGSGSDDLWRLRENPQFGNGPTGSVYESGGAWSSEGTVNTDDCPRLATTVSGLENKTYGVYVYFWSDTSQWCIRAGLNNTPIPLMLYYGTSIPDSPASPIAPSASPPVSPQTGLNFNAPVPMYSAGNRWLYQAYLGTVTGTEITVYVDDFAHHGAHNYRTWYDGIGYVPEPATIALLGLGVVMLRKRK